MRSNRGNAKINKISSKQQSRQTLMKVILLEIVKSENLKINARPFVQGCHCKLREMVVKIFPDT